MDSIEEPGKENKDESILVPMSMYGCESWGVNTLFKLIADYLMLI